MRLSIRSLKLKTRMVLILGLMVLLQTGLIGAYAIHTLNTSLSDQVAERALHVAKTIAAMPTIGEAISTKDLPYLSELAHHLATTNNALFVVIGDNKGIRLAHPTPAKVGQPMYDDEGDYNEPALIYGKPYTQMAVGSLGASVRGKAPIFDDTGKNILGIISVGFTLGTVESASSNYRNTLLLVIISSLLLSILIALWFSQHFKKAIFGLEPEEIGRLYKERNATLETVREGIIAINKDGYITIFNKAAIDTLDLDPSTQLTGKHIQEILPESSILDALTESNAIFDREIWLRDKNLVVNRIPLLQNGHITGAVSSFRLKNEIDLVSEKLTHIQVYADNLRSQSHDYANKLQTIAGLIEFGSHTEALQLIGQESQGHQEFIGLLTDIVTDPVLSGFLLGKYNRAKELGLKLLIDTESSMHQVSPKLPMEHLVSVLGNLIDNALEATLKQKGQQVHLHMTDLGQELIFEIEDQGPGLNEEEEQLIFGLGYSSKQEPGHGYGLHLVQQLLPLIKGRLTLDNLTTGARFILYLDKEWSEKEWHK